MDTRMLSHQSGRTSSEEEELTKQHEKKLLINCLYHPEKKGYYKCSCGYLLCHECFNEDLPRHASHLQRKI